MTTSTPLSSTGSAPARERLLTPAFVGLAVADLAYFTAVGVSILALPLYVTGPVGAGTAGAGLAFGAFAITALILRPLAGRLADTIGRRPLLLCGALLCAVGMVATAHVESLALVVGIRLLAGVGEAAFFVAGFAALVDIAPPKRLGEALSYNSLGLYLGITGGPLLGGLLIAVWGFTGAWYGAAVLALVAAAVVLTIGETRDPAAADAEPSALIHRGAIAPTLGLLASIVAMGGFLAFAALHAADLRMVATGVPLAAYGAVVVVCRIAFARIPDRFPPLALGAAALCLIAAGLVVMAAIPTTVGLVLGAVVLALGVTFSTPAFFAAVFATARPSERGAASATASIALDLGLGGGPIMLGLVAGAAGIPTAFVVAAAVALVGAGWTAILHRRAGFAGLRAAQ
ncbi:MFS transporter [Isoptericola croceus]|uniref:MFS transporter n=1 Tax=Isoptericola croceus TaxID=3031406 RepID=UPI0023F8219F|nr:MFS transporter [Isoptericola croceus]